MVRALICPKWLPNIARKSDSFFHVAEDWTANWHGNRQTTGNDCLLCIINFEPLQNGNPYLDVAESAIYTYKFRDRGLKAHGRKWKDQSG